ncbi:hypothetical protein MGN70_004362 [Eutypa lata]|uniref:Putative von willebrand factor protein n=1 Tax=Eutypa lata (strain UCR-EL1) TaxID=1287681 RepID=M7SC91_EUTLA|nr:putative von willebrand factor protein [Eutypa lata UCREL1]KAI1253967.1 hypothetical protein MGN70_004362 [Eutypa lata]
MAQNLQDEEVWPTFATPVSDDEAGAGIDVSNYDETLGFLRCFDTMFIVDDSAHMQPYWSDVGQLLETLSSVCAKHDPDGIDIYFLNHRPKSLLPSLSVRKSGYRGIGGPEAKKNSKTAAAIFNKVKPGGKCNLGARLTKILNWYCDKLKADDEEAALNLIVITAGVFEDDIRTPLINVARMLDDLKMPEHQVGIQLFNIRPDAAVQEAFDYLDDELHKEARTRDIVDTTTWTGTAGNLSSDDLLKVILGAVVKKLDQRKSALALNKSKSVRVKRYDD